jgi:uncharacterized protein YciI
LYESCILNDEGCFAWHPVAKRKTEKMVQKLTFLAVLCCAVLFSNAQSIENYNAALAQKTGADEYGMKQYVMAFLKKGTTAISDTGRRKELLRGHMANITRLAASGKLVVAGPMMDDTGLEGIFVFNVKTVAEAEALSQTDPAVKAGMFAMEYHPWYATAALMEVVGIHATLQKKKM